MADTFYSYDEPEEPEKAMAESMLPDGVKDFVREFSVAVNRGSLYGASVARRRRVFPPV